MWTCVYILFLNLHNFRVAPSSPSTHRVIEFHYGKCIFIFNTLQCSYCVTSNNHTSCDSLNWPKKIVSVSMYIYFIILICRNEYRSLVGIKYKLWWLQPLFDTFNRSLLCVELMQTLYWRVHWNYLSLLVHSESYAERRLVSEFMLKFGYFQILFQFRTCI